MSDTLELAKYTVEARSIVASAQNLADEQKHPEVTPLHLLARLVDQARGVAEVLRKVGADPVEIRDLVELALRKTPKQSSGVAYVSPRLLDLLARAEREAHRDKAELTGVEHLLHALAQEIRGPAGEILSAQGVTPGVFRPHVSVLQEAAASSAAERSAAAAASPSEALRDLVAEARANRFDPVIGRDLEVRRLLQILERRFKNHPLLVGEPGVGKTSVLRALAMRIAAGDVPSNLAGARLFELDTGALVAGAKLRGEIEQRLKQVIDRLRAIPDAEVVLVVEDIDALFGQGASGSGVGDLLKPCSRAARSASRRPRPRRACARSTSATRPSCGASACSRSRPRASSRRARSCEASPSATSGTTACASARAPSPLPSRSRSATCPIAPSRTPPSTCSTRPRAASAWRSTACPPRSTHRSAASTR
jgi:ATP-dependent Clp protease ATP-binding subunit ClpB